MRGGFFFAERVVPFHCIYYAVKMTGKLYDNFVYDNTDIYIVYILLHLKIINFCFPLHYSDTYNVVIFLSKELQWGLIIFQGEL